MGWAVILYYILKFVFEKLRLSQAFTLSIWFYPCILFTHACVYMNGCARVYFICCVCQSMKTKMKQLKKKINPEPCVLAYASIYNMQTHVRHLQYRKGKISCAHGFHRKSIVRTQTILAYFWVYVWYCFVLLPIRAQKHKKKIAKNSLAAIENVFVGDSNIMKVLCW